MKHICHITTSHKARDIRIFQRECLGLVNRGFKVTLIATGNIDKPKSNLNVIPLPYTSSYFFKKLILPYIALKIAKKVNADVYHFHDPELLLPMSRFAKKTKKPVIWDAHESYIGTLAEFTFKRMPMFKYIGVRLFDFFEKRCCRHFAAVIGVTDPITERYSRIGVKAVTIGNYIDLSKLPKKYSTVVKPDIFSIIASGTANDSRCIRTLIEAFALVIKKYPNTIFQLLASFDSEKARKSILNQISANHLEGRLKLQGLVDWEDLLTKEIPYADLGVVLYQKTQNNMAALPNRLFEYWACKKPVLVSRMPLLEKIIMETKGGEILDSSSPKAVADGIIYFIEHPEVAKQEGIDGYNAVVDKYSWSFELNKLCEMYSDVLA